MTAREFAATLNGCEEITISNKQLAIDNKLVIVTGASDDIMSFDGVIHGQGDCDDGGTVRFTKNGVISNWDEVEDAIDTLEENGIPLARFHTEMDINKIDAIWCPDGINDNDGNHIDGIRWSYETSIPHETFFMYKDGEVYCRGIVFKLSDLQ